MPLVKWRRDDGMIVLFDQHKPFELWLSIKGEIFDFHFQLGRLVIMVETTAERRWERKARRMAARVEKEEARARHPAAQAD